MSLLSVTARGQAEPQGSLTPGPWVQGSGPALRWRFWGGGGWKSRSVRGPAALGRQPVYQSIYRSPVVPFPTPLGVQGFNAGHYFYFGFGFALLEVEPRSLPYRPLTTSPVKLSCLPAGRVVPLSAKLLACVPALAACSSSWAGSRAEHELTQPPCLTWDCPAWIQCPPQPLPKTSFEGGLGLPSGRSWVPEPAAMLTLFVLRKAEDSLGNTLLVLWAPKTSAPFQLWSLL